jgi:hypothetical protein
VKKVEKRTARFQENSRAHFFPIFSGGVFSGFPELSGGKSTKKRAFSDVLKKKFRLSHFQLEVAAARMGRELRFYERCEHDFQFWVDFVLLCRKLNPDKRNNGSRFTNCLLLQGSVATLLFRFGCEMASKKSERFCSTIIGIEVGEESMYYMNYRFRNAFFPRF